MKKTTELFINLSVILIAVLVIALMPNEKDAAIYEDTLRLHILANSDSDKDQALKYEIRNRILDKYADQLKDADSLEEAAQEVNGLLSDIEADVEDWIREEGYNYGCDVALGTEWYGTREYEGFTLPKGYYTSLSIRLGEADGKNWWCVMYPPLCLDIASESSPSDDALLGYSKEECLLISGNGYNVKFKILEILSDAFSKNG